MMTHLQVRRLRSWPRNTLLTAALLLAAAPLATAQAPVITAGQTFTVTENTTFGSFSPLQLDSGEPDSFTIASGNDAGNFLIDPEGVISISAAANLDFEATNSFTLGVVASAGGDDSAPVDVQINVTDFAGLSINETARGTAQDPAKLFTLTGDGNPAVTAVDSSVAGTFSITGGTGAGIFTIDANTGVVSLDETAQLDFETTPSYTIEVTVTEPGGATTPQDVTVSVLDDNEPPVMSVAETLPIPLVENTQPATVATVTGTDPDAAAWDVTYAISSIIDAAGEPVPDAFVIDGTTGVITVGNVDEIDYEAHPPTPSFTITVLGTEVDPAPPPMPGESQVRSTTIEVTVDLTNVEVEPLLIADQAFTFDEESDPIGTLRVVNGENRGKSHRISTQTDLVGNSVNYFTIDIDDGEIRLNPNSVSADFTVNNPFTVEVEVTPDSPLAGETSPATAQVTLNYVSEKVPGGTPFMLGVSDYLLDLVPGNEAGTVYGLVRLADGTIQLRIYDSAFSRQQVVAVPGTSASDSAVEGLAVTGEFIVVTTQDKVFRYDIADPTAAPLQATLGFNGTIRDLAVREVGGIGYVYICGKDTADGRFFWQRRKLADLALDGSTHRWGFSAGNGRWTPQLWVIFAGTINLAPLDVGSAANYRLYSIEVDSSGNVYVAGSFQDPLHTTAVGGIRAYGAEVPVPGTTGKSLYFGRGGWIAGLANSTLPVQPKRVTGFIYKFNGSGVYQAGVHDGGADVNSYVQSYVRDLELTEDNGSTSVYALMQFRGPGTLGAEAMASSGYARNSAPFDTLTLGTADIKVMKFNSELTASGSDGVARSADNLAISSEDREISLAVDAQRNIYLMGRAPGGRISFAKTSGTTANDPEINPDTPRYYAAKLDTNRNWQWARLFGLGQYTPLNAHPRAGLARWHTGMNALMLGGNLESGTITIQDGNDVNSTDQNAFFTFLSSGNDFLGSNGLTIVSEFGDGGVHVLPFKGTQTVERGETVQISVPEIIYFQRGLGGALVPMGSQMDPPTPEEIRANAVMRAVNTGYTVADISGESQLADFSDPSNSYTFVFERSTKVTFNWRVEYALEIANDLAGTGAQTDGATGDWLVGDAANGYPGLGLTSTAAGNPDPVVKKHWVEENELTTAFIDGKVDDLLNLGTRYLVDGWVTTGSALGSSLPTGANLQARQQVPQFVMDGPATITFKWRIQHRVQTSASNTLAEDAPQVRAGPAYAIPPAGNNGHGSGEHWFDRGSNVRIGSLQSFAGKELTGWINASAPFTPEASPTSLGSLTSDGTFTYLQVNGLDAPVRVAWNYNDTIYRTTTPIGDIADIVGAVDAAGTPLGLGPVETSAGSGILRQPNRVTVVDSPPGSTGNDMQVWDDVADQLLPLRPGIMFLEWDIEGSDNKTVVEVTSEFPVEPHFRHLFAPGIPNVVVDPDAGDNIAFLELKYSNGDANVTEGLFSSSKNGQAVLLFSRSDTAQSSGGDATGDTNRETLQVRVAETSVWNQAGINATSEAIIARPVPSNVGGVEYDTAGIGTGFIIHENARYNANIHDRTRVADAGPVIPVNRHFEAADPDGINRNDLVVIWYEKKNAILWPHASVEYLARWPAALDRLDPDPPPVESDYLRRIVIASRLGSESKDNALRDQISFSADRFSEVKLYNQPRRDRPGYNPNEEHALIAPSFKFLDQANPPPTAYALRRDLNVTAQGAGYTSDPYVLVEYFDNQAGDDGAYRMAIYQIDYDDPTVPLEVDANGRSFPYIFDYEMVAGEPVQPPYPLGLVIGLTPCEETFGRNLGTQRTYWEDHRGQPWAVSDGSLESFFYYPQALDFWNGPTPPGTCLPFIIAGSIPGSVIGTQSDPTFEVGDQFLIGGNTVTLTGTSLNDLVAAFNQVVDALPAGDDLSNVEADVFGANQLRIRHNNGGGFGLQDGPGRPLEKAGLRYVLPGVTYRVRWPEDPPVLKAGETLTYPGGEWKADHPESPGLPGVIGWAAGTVVYDSLTPTMSGTEILADPENYTARLVAPLETLRVRLALGTEERTSISPATGITKVDGTVWRFTGVSASLQKRVFYDPLSNELGISGYVNDKTLGDGTLTAAPAPVYVLEPNILTDAERDELLALDGLSDISSWTGATGAVSRLYTKGRNPQEIMGAGYLAGLENDTVSGGAFVARDILTHGHGDGSLDATYFLLFHPDNPVWVALDLGDSGSLYSGTVDDVNSDGFDAGDPDWDSDTWVGDDDVVTHQVVFTSGDLDGQRFDITSNDGDDIDLDTGGQNMNDLGLDEDDRFRIVEKNSSLTQPGVGGGFDVITVSGLSAGDDAGAVASTIAGAITTAGKGYVATASGNRISLTYNGGPASARDGNTGFSFVEPEDPALDSFVLDENTAVPATLLGPGLALVPGARVLDPASNFSSGYVTIVENNDPDLGGPVSLFVIKVSKEHRYRGAIKTILSDNVFDEKITLRHTGDFGANTGDIVYQWFYREEDGSETPLPPNAAWKLFPDQSDNAEKGLGQFQVSLEGAGGLLLADNQFFVRYRHKNDDPADGFNSVNWGPEDSLEADEEAGATYTDWWNDGKPRKAADHADLDQDEVIGELFAGAGNSPGVDGDYKPQLVQGWVKRVLDRINPYEARFNDFRNNEVPATYVSMIQQTGPPYVGPVALNPDKNVVENYGLLELYHTIFDRATALSIGLSSPITTPGINNALLLASSRLSDLYMLLGNEAYSDALDPTIGFGSDSAEYGNATPSIFSFQNQMGSLLDEELSLLRGVDESFARPVFNRLFWNFTKNEGEAAYAVNYNITDQNLDGFIDESDAMILFPQGHGDAWGHYLSAMRQQYDLLKHPFFNWVSRSEQYNLLDIVISVDFEDERKFATAAAAKARAGADVVNQTYRSRYVANPDGQWQGYTDPDQSRAWGVQGWARRAGQGALFDWVTANAILPAEDTRNTGIVNESLKRIDRGTVTAIGEVSSYHGKIQGTYDNANQGLNPLGLADEVVPFDIDPNFDIVGSGIQGQQHFEQIYERAEKAAVNALRVFDNANQHGNRLRQQQVTADDFYQETYDQDRAYRNELIQIFGTPYAGTIGPGLPYPSGYKGPDINLWFYVDVSEVSNRTVPQGSGSFAAAFSGFNSALAVVENQAAGGESLYDFQSPNYPFFVNDVLNPDDFDRGLASDLSAVTGMTNIDEDGNLFMNLPLKADDYVFQAPSAWGRRAAPGELQQIIAEMIVAEAELALAQGDYDNYIKELVDMADLLAAKSGLNADLLQLKIDNRTAVTTLNGFIQTLRTIAAILNFTADFGKDTAEAIGNAADITAGLANNVSGPVKSVAKLAGTGIQFGLRVAALASEQTSDILEITKERRELTLEIDETQLEMTFEIREQIKEIEQHLRNEATTRIEVFTKIEELREISDRYRAALERGLALLDEREDFNKFTAATTQQTRYQDMAFRVFRNSALEKYRDAFDLAARYTYLAAKAYDYDTNLSPDDPSSAQGLLNDIVKARHLGGWSDDSPRVGSGLAGALAVMRDNYDVHKTQLGLNNFQQEVGKISLREGHFRNKKNEELGTPGAAVSNAIWRQVLQDSRVANLWDVPEFRRHCRPPRAESQGPLPGLVLEFPTEVIFGNNVFGWPLGGGDFAYDPTNFATKIRGAGVWFEGYDNSALSVSPRVYLVPAGLDVMTIPNSETLETRTWNVVDQSIPPPFVTTDNDLADPDFIPSVHSLDGPFAEIRKFSSFRAYGDTAGTPPVEDQMSFDSRLVGRSVWNTRWLLIIPGGTLLNNGDTGLDTFISDVSDIKLFFHTLGYSGN